MGYVSERRSSMERESIAQTERRSEPNARLVAVDRGGANKVGAYNPAQSSSSVSFALGCAFR